jgi:phage I-like protein
VKSIDKKIFTKQKTENICNRYAASLNIKNELKMKKKLIELLHLEGVTETSTDEEILEKVREKFTELENASEKEAETNVNALISSAQKEGKIPVNMIEIYREIGRKSGLSVLTNVLSSIQKPPSIMSMIKPDSKKTEFQKDRSQWTLEDYRKYDPKAFERNSKLFDELYKKEFENQ